MHPRVRLGLRCRGAAAATEDHGARGTRLDERARGRDGGCNGRGRAARCTGKDVDLGIRSSGVHVAEARYDGVG
jgi:hypothetical protein